MRRALSPRLRRRVACVAWALKPHGATWVEAMEAASNIVTATTYNEPIEEAAAEAIAHRRRHFGLDLGDDRLAVACVLRAWLRLMAVERAEVRA